MSTLEGVKRYINKMGNAPSTMTPKQIVMLDWVSNEDGSHILTVTVGNKVGVALFQYYAPIFWQDKINWVCHLPNISYFMFYRYCCSQQYPMTSLKQMSRLLMMPEMIRESDLCCANLRLWHFSHTRMMSGIKKVLVSNQW